jgi:hypothetical protein
MSPVTTPTATLIRSSDPKKRASRRYVSSPLRYHAVSRRATRKARPMVIGTKRKW